MKTRKKNTKNSELLNDLKLAVKDLRDSKQKRDAILNDIMSNKK